MHQCRVIVDGMNVIGSRADGWWRDRPSAMRALVESLAVRAPAEGEGVTIVFDGRPLELEEREGVEVLFARRSGRKRGGRGRRGVPPSPRSPLTARAAEPLRVWRTARWPRCVDSASTETLP